jgi:hypothetical protein
MKMIKSCSAKKTLNILVSATLLSFVLYSFAIASTTVHISDAKLMNEDILELRTELASLESSYYTMVNDLSLDQAYSEGFVSDTGVHFAHVNQTTLVAYRN